MSDPISHEARRLIGLACARINNDHESAPRSPERLRHTETMGMLWEAMGLLDPDAGHPEDAGRYHERRRALASPAV